MCKVRGEGDRPACTNAAKRSAEGWGHPLTARGAEPLKNKQGEHGHRVWGITRAAQAQRGRPGNTLDRVGATPPARRLRLQRNNWVELRVVRTRQPCGSGSVMAERTGLPFFIAMFFLLLRKATPSEGRSGRCGYLLFCVALQTLTSKIQRSRLERSLPSE